MGFTVRSLSAVYQKLPPENVSLWRRVYSEQPPADAATLITLTNVDPSVLALLSASKQEAGNGLSADESDIFWLLLLSF